jgi:hypothetical protein
MAHVVEHLPIKLEALSSNHSIGKVREGREGGRKRGREGGKERRKEGRKCSFNSWCHSYQ